MAINPPLGGANIERDADRLAVLAAKHASDKKVAVSSNDTTPDYLLNKLTAGTNITLTETTDGGDETITIASSGGSNPVHHYLNPGDFGVRTGSATYLDTTPSPLFLPAWSLTDSGAYIEVSASLMADQAGTVIRTWFYWATPATSGSWRPTITFLQSTPGSSTATSGTVIDSVTGAHGTAYTVMRNELSLVTTVTRKNLLQFRVLRNSSDAADTINDTIYLLGLMVGVNVAT